MVYLAGRHNPPTKLSREELEEKVGHLLLGGLINNSVDELVIAGIQLSKGEFGADIGLERFGLSPDAAEQLFAAYTYGFSRFEDSGVNRRKVSNADAFSHPQNTTFYAGNVYHLTAPGLIRSNEEAFVRLMQTGLLHDNVEDTTFSLKEAVEELDRIGNIFGGNVRENVLLLTNIPDMIIKQLPDHVLNWPGRNGYTEAVIRDELGEALATLRENAPDELAHYVTALMQFATREINYQWMSDDPARDKPDIERVLQQEAQRIKMHELGERTIELYKEKDPLAQGLVVLKLADRVETQNATLDTVPGIRKTQMKREALRNHTLIPVADYLTSQGIADDPLALAFLMHEVKHIAAAYKTMFSVNMRDSSEWTSAKQYATAVYNKLTEGMSKRDVGRVLELGIRK